MPRYLFIVSRHDPTLFAILKERFADDENVQVILDRRVHAAPPEQRPHGERRMRSEVNESIRVHAYAVVTLQ